MPWWALSVTVHIFAVTKPYNEKACILVSPEKAFLFHQFLELHLLKHSIYDILEIFINPGTRFFIRHICDIVNLLLIHRRDDL